MCDTSTGSYSTSTTTTKIPSPREKLSLPTDAASHTAPNSTIRVTIQSISMARSRREKRAYRGAAIDDTSVSALMMDP